MPGLLHAGGLHANNRADMSAGSRDFRVAQLARSSPLADPIGGQSRFAIRRADMDVAAKADDVLKAKIVQELEQLDVAEAAVGQDRGAHALRQRLLQAAETGVFEIVALVLQFVLV